MGSLRRIARRIAKADPRGYESLRKLRRDLANALTANIQRGVTPADASAALLYFAALLAKDAGQAELDFAKAATNAYVGAVRDDEEDDEEESEDDE